MEKCPNCGTVLRLFVAKPFVKGGPNRLVVCDDCSEYKRWC